MLGVETNTKLSVVHMDVYTTNYKLLKYTMKIIMVLRSYIKYKVNRKICLYLIKTI